MQISSEKVHQSAKVISQGTLKAQGARTEERDAALWGWERGLDLGTEVGGQRSQVGGRGMMVGGRRGPGRRGGKKGAAAWEWSILLVRQVPTRVAKMGWGAPEIERFRFARVTRSSSQKMGGGRRIKWFPAYWCLASVSPYRAACLNWGSLSGISLYPCRITARIPSRKIHVLDISRQMTKFVYVWNSYFHKSASECGYAISAFCYTLFLDYFNISDNDHSFH